MDNYGKQTLIKLTEKMKNTIWIMRNTQHPIFLEYRTDYFGDLGRSQKRIVYGVTEKIRNKFYKRKLF